MQSYVNHTAAENWSLGFIQEDLKRPRYAFCSIGVVSERCLQELFALDVSGADGPALVDLVPFFDGVCPLLPYAAANAARGGHRTIGFSSVERKDVPVLANSAHGLLHHRGTHT
jgi:hypothetical protein